VRAFFALWPGEEERRLLHAQANAAAKQSGGRAIAFDKLHLTLLFLGEVDEREMACLGAGAGRVIFEDFNLALSLTGTWRKAGVAWIAPEEVPVALTRLQASLAAAARDCGVRLESRAYLPHLTLARKAAAAMPRARIAPIMLRCEGFCLVRSDLGSGRYEVVGRWP
jgi:2'-5' RNA ligase